MYEKWDTLERDQKRNIIETIVDKIIVGKDDIEINLYKILPDGYMPPSLESGTNGQHTIWGVLPICNLQFLAKKPCRLPFPAENDKTLGAELKRQRIILEWTQEATEKHFGILKDSYQGWEWNKNAPQLRYRKKVIEFLGFNYWYDGSNSLANRCLLYRIEHELTHEQLAEKLNLSMVTIGRIEIGKRKVSDITIEKIEKLLKQKINH